MQGYFTRFGALVPIRGGGGVVVLVPFDEARCLDDPPFLERPALFEPELQARRAFSANDVAHLLAGHGYHPEVHGSGGLFGFCKDFHGEVFVIELDVGVGIELPLELLLDNKALHFLSCFCLL